MTDHFNMTLPEYVYIVDDMKNDDILGRKNDIFIDRSIQKIKLQDEVSTSVDINLIVRQENVGDFNEWINFVGGNPFVMKYSFGEEESFRHVRIREGSVSFRPIDRDKFIWKFNMTLEFREQDELYV